MAPPFSLSDRAADVRPGGKTQWIALTLRQVADLLCARTKEREYFKTCIVGHVNCCLQCGPTLRHKNDMKDVGGTVESESVLRSAGTLSRVRAPPLAARPDEGRGNLKSP
ncbi:hypothetical protein PoB_002011100 [Plakobranchus ocellatus]|uniref:Uncharacterized protein n=1 Tax=Plakobranchus ocellatus TaxID=259542 RepID=A0AAV3Z2R3_9GAST|nr:hypothetical protein PoB_002011100 [Plakobranchus ocellatus]